MTGIVYINGIIGEDYKLSDALLDVQKNKINDFITLKIGSDGGFVDVADEIYNIFKNTGKVNRTENIGNVASAAVKFLLLAPKGSRFFDTSKGVLLIHNPYNLPNDDGGDATYHKMLADELGKLEKGLISFYSESTGTDYNILKGFMDINEPLTGEQIESLGFANLLQQEFKAVAKINNLNIDEMTENDKSWIAEKLAALFKTHSKVVALMVADASGKNLDFGTQIETSEQIAVGMTAKFEDGTIPTGEITMPTGAILVFDEKGVITEIKEAQNDNSEMEALKKTIEDLKLELEAEKSAKAQIETDYQAKLEKLPEQLTTKIVALYEEREEKAKMEEEKTKFTYKGKKQ